MGYVGLCVEFLTLRKLVGDECVKFVRRFICKHRANFP